jgi:hypothetical protein
MNASPLQPVLPLIARHGHNESHSRTDVPDKGETWAEVTFRLGVAHYHVQCWVSVEPVLCSRFALRL